MAEEFSRTTARKRIYLGTKFVDVPVITKISFIDPADRYQEWQYSIENSAQGLRLAHVDNVQGDGANLLVERVDKWVVTDIPDRVQETQLEMDNVTGADSVPPHFSTHLETHVVRYKNPDDSDVWIESELIDKFIVHDPVDRGQDTIFALANPQNDDDAQANPDDPDISDAGSFIIDPPWRTDPFQNIVNLHVPATGLFKQIFVFRRMSLGGYQACNATNSSVVGGGNGGDWYPVDNAFWLARESAGETYPAGTAGSSILSMHSVAFRNKHSDLVNACLALSLQAGQSPGSEDGIGGVNPRGTWSRLSISPQLSCADVDAIENGVPIVGPVIGIEQPSSGNTAVQMEQYPPGSGVFKPHFIYLGVLGYYQIEDGFSTAGAQQPFVPPT
jgi:hypothetical protein